MSPDFKTGVTRAIFIFSGKVPFLRDKSKMYFNGTKNDSNNNADGGSDNDDGGDTNDDGRVVMIMIVKVLLSAK